MNVVCYMLYVVYLVGCWCHLGGILGGLWGHLVDFEARLGYVGAIFGPLWEILGDTWHTLVVRVQGLGFDRHSAYPFEMLKSLSTYACAPKTFA